MSQSTAASASDTRYGHVPSHVPSHVPAHLVHDFEHYEDPLFRSDPFAVVERTRSQTPDVFFSPRLGGFWVVASYELVREVYRNNELFSSRYIGVPAAEFPYVLMPLQLDPPAHMRYRNILNPMFAPRMVDQWEDGIRDICRSLINGFHHQRGCEFVDAFASKLPNRVFVSLMGLSEDELPTFLAWEHDLLHGTVGSGRTVNRDMEFAGVVMKAGDRVLCSAAFANADPRMFADGRGSDLQRQPNLHLTFGVGPHAAWGRIWPGANCRSRCRSCMPPFQATASIRSNRLPPVAAECSASSRCI
jgi:cytochrome P450